jgi:ribosomal protein S12 methylthiotransferase
MNRLHFISLGCPKNLVDSELMMGAMAREGYTLTLDPNEADVLVVNTCAFIDGAKRESLDAILEAAEIKRRRPGRRLVVAGCLSQRYGTELRKELPEVDLFVGTGNFLELPSLLRQADAASPVYRGAAHLLPDHTMARLHTGNPASAYLKVSEGCNHKCAFCIIPKIRGKHESRPIEDIIHEAEALAASGVQEFNLIAQDLTAYGRDLQPPISLAELLRRLDAVSGVRWIRLLYCYPNFVTDELLDAIAELPRVVKYLDMPLQHADDNILRTMRRERSADALRRLLDRVRRRVPDVTLRTSFIVGFPGETDDAFDNLIEFVEEQRFDRVGVFTYSREEDTDAAAMESQVPERVKRERRAHLMSVQAEISLEKNRSLVGRELEVLIENESASNRARAQGRGPGQAPEIDGSVVLRGSAPIGSFVRARIERATAYDLHGVLTAFEN